MRKTLKTQLLCAAVAAAGLTFAGLPAAAQAVSEITVMGSYGPDGQAETLSAPVTFSDLDLTVPADQDVLKTRIRDTARDLCAKLGETGSGDALAPGCADAAQKDAWKQAEVVIATAVPRGAPMAMNEPMPAPEPMAPAATTYSTPAATVTTTTVTNGPVADTPENRAKYGQPMSNAGKRTQPSGN